MKSKSRQLLDKATAAMTAAIEIHNKPGFPYRAESFAILAINGWELLLKAKFVDLNGNDVRPLYVPEYRNNLDGTKRKKPSFKRSRTNAPLTRDITYVAQNMVQQKMLDNAVWQNLQLLLEFRDTAMHFYNTSTIFQARMYEINAACVRNFAIAALDWFNSDLSGFDIGLMPLTFFNLASNTDSIVVNASEKNFLSLLEQIETPSIVSESEYTVMVNVGVRFVKSKDDGALLVRTTNDPNAIPVHLTDEEIRDRYPHDYRSLTNRCRDLYLDFKENSDYHRIRRPLEADERFCTIRFLDPGNPKSAKKKRYNGNIFREFDKHYNRKNVR